MTWYVSSTSPLRVVSWQNVQGAHGEDAHDTQSLNPWHLHLDDDRDRDENDHNISGDVYRRRQDIDCR